MIEHNFKLMSQVKGDGDIEYNYYKSVSTGMSVVIAQVEGPLVSGYLTIATEAHDDDGLPHTLEHLIFLGSENYPFKGVLDLLANRCLADGTNAWTDTDHTCYTLKTAGADGFLNLLPIYVDHVLFPTLTDSGFITEVHHINSEGEDAGVVYCEMQARENTGEELCSFTTLQLMYPGHCGYKSNTGGRMKNLRESTTNEKIRNYHRNFYRSENFCVIIAGEIDPQAVFKSLMPIEEKIIKVKDSLPPFVKPWQTPVLPLDSSVEKTIQYPSDDDDNGIVVVSWRGPLAISQYEDLISLSLLSDYLNDTAISPLQQAFVECDDPYCSSVCFSIIENYESCLELTFESVVKKKLKKVKNKLFDLLNKIGKRETPFDIERMLSLIHRKKMQHLSSLETSPHSNVASVVIGYFLYGNSEHDLLVRSKQIPIIDELMKKDADFWVGLLNKYFLGDAKHVVVIGEPSISKMKQMTKEEKQRVEQQRKAIGDAGLKQKGIELEKAKENNEIPPPEEMLRMVPVPDVGNIHFHSIIRSNNYIKDYISGDILGFDSLSKIPYKFQLDNIKSNFITIRALLNTSKCLSPRHRLYLPLWGQLVSESAILRDGILIPYEEAVRELASDTIHNGASIGIGGGVFNQILAVMVKVELEKYEKGLKWLSELLYSTQFIADRIKTVATRMVNDIAQTKRKGNKVTAALIKSICFKPDSNHWAVGFYRQNKFLKDLLKKLETSPKEVEDEFNELRSLITDISNLTIHLSVNASLINEKVSNPEQLWIDNFLPKNIQRENVKDISKENVDPCYKYLSDENYIAKYAIPQGAIAGVGSVESNFLVQCVESINSFNHPDLAPLLVLMQYLTQLEGPMWRQIRGSGLSYHYSLYLQITEGLLYFYLFKATQLVGAYKEAFKIVKNHLNGEEKWSDSLLESSKSSLVFELIEREKSVAGLSFESMLCYYRDVDMNYNKELIKQVSSVTFDDMNRVGPIYLLPLFDVNKSRCSICCHPSKVDETTTGFKEFGKELKVINTEEDNFTSEIPY